MSTVRSLQCIGLIGAMLAFATPGQAAWMIVGVGSDSCGKYLSAATDLPPGVARSQAGQPDQFGRGAGEGRGGEPGSRGRLRSELVARRAADRGIRRHDAPGHRWGAGRAGYPHGTGRRLA